jgi:hypothetical protein
VLIRFGKGFIETSSLKGEKGAMTLLHVNYKEIKSRINIAQVLNHYGVLGHLRER